MPREEGKLLLIRRRKKKTTDEVSEENKAEEAPEVAVPEPEIPSSTRFLIIFDIALDIESNPIP